MKVLIYHWNALVRTAWGDAEAPVAAADHAILPVLHSLPKFVDVPVPTEEVVVEATADDTVALCVAGVVVGVWLLIVMMLYFRWIVVVTRRDYIVFLRNRKVCRMAKGPIVFCKSLWEQPEEFILHDLRTDIQCPIEIADATITLHFTITYDILTPSDFFALGDTVEESTERFRTFAAEKIKSIFDGQSIEALWTNMVYVAAKNQFKTKYTKELEYPVGRSAVMVTNLEYIAEE